MAADTVLLLGCGILQNEVKWLVKKNAWPLDTVFLDSILHVDFEKLASNLNAALDKHAGRKITVLYGACHPQMDAILASRQLRAIPGQNCVEMLLGHMRFTAELANGAFFLLEEWARRWQFVMSHAIGTNPHIVRNVFQNDRRYVLALRTPCSGDFSALAQNIADQVGLPLRWADISLDHLEQLIQAAIDRET
jgi:hypothetical protein